MMKTLMAIGAAIALASTAAANEAYPSKPVRMVDPYAAGGAADFVARTVGDRLAKALGQPVVVDNKAGAAGAIGASEVARARLDGHTLLMTITDTQINNTTLDKTLSYDPRKDFIGVAQMVRNPALAHPGTGVRSLADLEARVPRVTRA